MTESIDGVANTIHEGDAAETLAELPESSVHMEMTELATVLLGFAAGLSLVAILLISILPDLRSPLERDRRC